MTTDFVIVWVSMGLAAFALYVAGFNWYVVICRPRYQENGHLVSLIPFVGGVLGAVAIRLQPIEGIRPLWWVAMLLDYGCIPGLVAEFWYRLRAKSPADRG